MASVTVLVLKTSSSFFPRLPEIQISQKHMIQTAAHGGHRKELKCDSRDGCGLCQLKSFYSTDS